jgi:hypothetical protein
MAINFQCPECKQKFRTEDAYAGRQWTCPKCSARFAIPEPDDDIPVEKVTARPRPPRREDEPEDDWDERDDRGYRDREDRDYRDRRVDRLQSPGWGSVRGGLRLLSTAFTILLVILVLILGLQLVALAMPPQARAPGAAPGAGAEPFAVAVGCVTILGAITFLILLIVGLALCCSAPGESGTKGFAVGSMLCLVGAILLIVIGIVALFAIAGGIDPRDQLMLRHLMERAIVAVALIGLAALVGLVGYILLVLFLRSVAVYFHNESLASNALIYLIVYLLYTAGSIAMAFFLPTLLFAGGQPGQVAGGMRAISLIQEVISMGLMGWFIYLLSATRSTIPPPEGARRRPEYY